MSDVGQAIGQDKRRLEVDDEAQIGAFGTTSYFELPQETLYIDPVNIRVNKIHPDLGSTFILGHPTASLLGTARLGYVLGSITRITESRFYEDFTENFSTTDYRDAGNTTADWDTTNGSLAFASGSVAQSLTLGSDIQLSTTKFNRIKLSVSGSNWVEVIGSVSSDNINWFPASFDVWTTLTAGSTGSEILWRLIDSNQNASITQINITYKQDDI